MADKFVNSIKAVSSSKKTPTKQTPHKYEPVLNRTANKFGF